MNTIQEILNGWGNVIKGELGILPQEVKELSKKRLLICNECPLRVKDICSKKQTGEVVKDFVYKKEIRTKGQKQNGCGCDLGAKTKVLVSMCPLGKW